MSNEPADSSLRHRVRLLLSGEAPLSSVPDELRRLKAEGHGRDAVQAMLEALRDECASEAEEDRILDVLDFVTGYCNREHRVWGE